MVVIAILASITIVSYNGIISKARDAQRSSDITSIIQALELYYIDNGQYPGSPSQTGGSTVINGAWSTTADGSWQTLVDTLKPYARGIGKDPISPPGVSPLSGGALNYAYFASASPYCGAAPYKMYILVYNFEASSKKQETNGDCSTNGLAYPNASYYRVVK